MSNTAETEYTMRIVEIDTERNTVVVEWAGVLLLNHSLPADADTEQEIIDHLAMQVPIAEIQRRQLAESGRGHKVRSLAERLRDQTLHVTPKEAPVEPVEPQPHSENVEIVL